VTGIRPRLPRVGLDQLLAEGVEKRLARYRKLAIRLREGLRKLGYKLYTSDEKMVPILTAAWTPEGVSSLEILEHLAQNYHIKISSGLGDLRDKIFRIGTMSPVVDEGDVDEVLEALSTFRK
jgi:alanine-glyoxylate transaminase/serine-glyoxylate transaminase/serine-pyruvate transaminase